MPDVAVYFVGGLVAFIGGFILGRKQRLEELKNLLGYLYYQIVNYADSDEYVANAYFNAFSASVTFLTDDTPSYWFKWFTRKEVK